jgi:kynurenine 3-monooxygenase
MAMQKWTSLLLLVASAPQYGFCFTSPLPLTSLTKDPPSTRVDFTFKDANTRYRGLATSSSTASTSSSIQDAVSDTNSASSPASHYDSVVVGGGPAGLLAGIMLAQMQPIDASTSDGQRPRIVVFDRLPPPPSPDNLVYSTDISKYYLLGLGHRGQRALRQFKVWDDVSKASVAVMGRRDWSPGKTREEDGVVRMSDKAVVSRVLARDKLVGVLKEVIDTRYKGVIDLKYGYQVDPVSFGDDCGSQVQLQVSQCTPLNDNEECSIENDNMVPATITTNFLIGADGAARTIANAMETNDVERRQRMNPLRRLFDKPQFRVTRYEDDNQRVYKSIPISFPSHWPYDLNYSARSTNNRAAFEALPSDANGNYCALLLLRPEDELAKADCDPLVLREFFNVEYPQFSKLLGDDVMTDVAKKPSSNLPGFRFAGPKLHEGGRTVILGDCIHTVKPYYGLGANTALEDVMILSDILNSTPDLSRSLNAAVEQFTKERSADSQALVTLSRGMDRPGKLGTVRFVLPLVLDSIFNKMAPKVFGPSMFGMFQKEGIGFRQIQRKKRLDRAMQSAVILSGLTLVGFGTKTLVKTVAKSLGLKSEVVGGSMFGLLALTSVARKLFAKKTETNA